MTILRHRFLSSIFSLSLALIILSFLLVCFRLDVGAKTLIIHFDSYQGIDVFGSRLNIFVILGFFLFIILMNFLLAEISFYREKIISFLLIFSGFFLSILALIAVNVIISVNQ